MEGITSPGVLSREFDFAMFVPSLAATICGYVGTASKGDVDKVTLITSQKQMVDTFGNTNANHPAVLAALKFLERGTQLKFIRVASNTLATSTYTIQDGTGSPAITLTVNALTDGTWGDDIQVKVSAGTKTNTFKFQVYYKGSLMETYDSLPDKATAIAKVNAESEFVTLVNVAANANVPANGIYTLDGGDDGLTGIADADYVGTVSDTGITGLQLFADASIEDLNIVAVPGISSDAVRNALVTLAEARRDVLALPDPPKGLTPQNAADLKTAEGSYSSNNALNSSRAATYYNWVEVYDSTIRDYVWMPPSAIVARTLATNDIVAEPWFAPAGLTRGRVTDARSVERVLTQGERDMLYEHGVNMITKLGADGIVVWGNKTTQVANSDLQSINIVRGLMYLEKVAASTVRYLIFEPNNPKTWRRFIGMMDPILRDIKARQGLYDYRIVCDNTTNTPDVIDRRQMRGQILLKWTKSTEFIVLDFTMIPTGATFQEYFNGASSI